MSQIFTIISKVVDAANTKGAKINRWDINENSKYRVYTKNPFEKCTGDTHHNEEIITFFLSAFDFINFYYEAYNLRLVMNNPFYTREVIEKSPIAKVANSIPLVKNKSKIIYTDKSRSLPKKTNNIKDENSSKLFFPDAKTDYSHMIANRKFKKHSIEW